MVKNVVRDGGGMGENALGSVAGEMTDSVSGYRYISLDTLQSFRSLQDSSNCLCSLYSSLANLACGIVLFKLY